MEREGMRDPKSSGPRPNEPGCDWRFPLDSVCGLSFTHVVRCGPARPAYRQGPVHVETPVGDLGLQATGEAFVFVLGVADAPRPDRRNSPGLPQFVGRSAWGFCTRLPNGKISQRILLAFERSY
jgi:hypothetical protein